MTRRLVFRRAALQDFEDAALWYEGRRPGLGSEFQSAIEDALRLIQADPLIFPGCICSYAGYACGDSRTRSTSSLRAIALLCSQCFTLGAILACGRRAPNKALRSPPP